jgi:hypothetical protein
MPALQKYNQSLNSHNIPTYYNGHESVPGHIDLTLTPQDQLSQVHVLQQVEHICTYKYTLLFPHPLHSSSPLPLSAPFSFPSALRLLPSYTYLF